MASRLEELDMKTEALTDLIYIDLPSSLRTLTLDNFDLLLGPPGLDTFAFRCVGLRKIKLLSSASVELVRQFADEHGDITFPMLHTLALRAVQVSPSRSGTADMRTLEVSRLNIPSLSRSHAPLRELEIAGVLFGALSLLHDVSPTIQRICVCVRATDEVMAALMLREDKENMG